jgi:hypothetical protein
VGGLLNTCFDQFAYCLAVGRVQQVQKLMDAKLKKAFTAGEKARKEGVDLLAAEDNGGSQQTEENAAKAEANAEELLQQEA